MREPSRAAPRVGARACRPPRRPARASGSAHLAPVAADLRGWDRGAGTTGEPPEAQGGEAARRRVGGRGVETHRRGRSLRVTESVGRASPTTSDASLEKLREGERESE